MSNCIFWQQNKLFTLFLAMQSQREKRHSIVSSQPMFFIFSKSLLLGYHSTEKQLPLFQLLGLSIDFLTIECGSTSAESQADNHMIVVFHHPSLSLSAVSFTRNPYVLSFVWQLAMNLWREISSGSWSQELKWIISVFKKQFSVQNSASLTLFFGKCQLQVEGQVWRWHQAFLDMNQ